MTKRIKPGREIRKAYSQDQLARICMLDERDFGREFGMETMQVQQKWTSRYKLADDYPAEDYYHFRDNGSRVLAVAHLDTVVRPAGRRPYIFNTDRGPFIRSGALDDRLGAYVILDLLPKVGITCDWLLTVGEESCASTAYDFAPPKDYDWAIEFDRGGTDVVMYQYEDMESSWAVEAAGAEMGQGSFSDIAALEHLGVKAFNWGVGYRGNYHSEKGYAYLNDTFAMVAKYMRFHAQNAGSRMEHKPGHRNDFDTYFDCDFCGAKNSVDSATWYCTACGTCQDCGLVDAKVAEEWNDPDVEVCSCYLPARLQESGK